MDVVVGVARLDIKITRRLGDLFQHEVRIEEDLVSVRAHPCRLEELDGLGHHEFDAELRNDAAPALIQDSHGLLGEDVVTRQGVLEHGISLNVALTGLSDDPTLHNWK